VDGRAELDALRRNCRELIAGLNGPLLERVLSDVGVETKGTVEMAVQRDIGDTSMSGWRRGRPVPITGRFDVFNGDAARGQSESDKTLVIRPTPRARGPMRVLQSGRHIGETGGAQGPSIVRTGATAGATRRTKTGTIAADRRARSRRWNGYVRPRDTWSDASEILARQSPKIAERLIVATIIRAIHHG
jgi:hypothetical protein